MEKKSVTPSDYYTNDLSNLLLKHYHKQTPQQLIEVDP